jgi:hypothetical protein
VFRFFFVFLLFLLSSCHKSTDGDAVVEPATDTSGFIQYTIKAGAHYADKNNYKPVAASSFAFLVRFDSSAVYKSTAAANQYDINKLYGFSDNSSEHHQYSARFGWRWSDGSLRLFAYVYNAGQVTSEALGPVPIGPAVRCRIEVDGAVYRFYCNEWQKTLPRKSKTANGKGYLLYPYFGGNETALHDVRIWIKDL